MARQEVTPPSQRRDGCHCLMLFHGHEIRLHTGLQSLAPNTRPSDYSMQACIGVAVEKRIRTLAEDNADADLALHHALQILQEHIDWA